MILQNCTAYTQEVYSKAGALQGSRWLMLNITDEDILEDAKELIRVRMKPRR